MPQESADEELLILDDLAGELGKPLTEFDSLDVAELCKRLKIAARHGYEKGQYVCSYKE